MNSIRITVVGDGYVGKTCLLLRFIKNEPPSGYEPTVFDNHSTSIEVDDKMYDIELWDTAGQEGYDRIRSLSYGHSNCFLVCFAIDSESSYKNVANVWVPEIRESKKNVPIILVGTKSDLRQDNNKNSVLPIEMGVEMLKRTGALKYVECSAITNDGIKEVFEEAVRGAAHKKKFCTIL